MKRNEILLKAEEAICGRADERYGSPEDNFERIAEFWSTYLGTQLVAEDVAVMMVLFKIGRVASGQFNEDNFIDMAGYSACAGECASL